MEFAVLGTLMARDGEVDCTPSAPKLRRVLATLVLCANKLVLTETLAEELWQDHPPATAMATMQTYVYQLRKALGSDGRDRDGVIRTQTDPPGYVLGVSPENVDLARFRKLLREGRRALEEHRPDHAAEVLRQALSLWRGPALGGVCSGPVLEAHAVRLEEEHMDALELRIDADLITGGHRELIPELKSLTIAHPLHERFQSRLMIALYLSARRGEALESFHRHRHILQDELGLEPNPEIQRIQQQILNSEPTSWHEADRVYLPSLLAT
jgi:DNA-binding SARP family transcriptional activator